MLPDQKKQELLYLTADTIDDCREQLGKLYGTDYEIMDRKNTTQNYGPFGLFQKPGVKVTYVVNRRSDKKYDGLSDEETQRLIRDEILARATGGKTKTEIQISEINAKVNEIASAMQRIPRGSGEERIESIERVEEMLDDNEFTRDFILGITARLKKEFAKMV